MLSFIIINLITTITCDLCLLLLLRFGDKSENFKEKLLSSVCYFLNLNITKNKTRKTFININIGFDAFLEFSLNARIQQCVFD